MNTVYKTITVKGRVQGVGFRFSAREKARKYGIKGYVKNLPNGDVEIMAIGPEHSVDEFIRWCNEGPAFAHVNDMEIEETEPKNYQTFDVKL